MGGWNLRKIRVGLEEAPASASSLTLAGTDFLLIPTNPSFSPREIGRELHQNSN